jgi:hypothetical protein
MGIKKSSSSNKFVKKLYYFPIIIDIIRNIIYVFQWYFK